VVQAAILGLTSLTFVVYSRKVCTRSLILATPFFKIPNIPNCESFFLGTTHFILSARDCLQWCCIHPTMARHPKRARLNQEASRSQPQSFSKRQKQRLLEAAHDTTAWDDVRYMRTQPKMQQPSDTSRAKSFPNETSQFIDLTLSDEVEELFPAYSPRPKVLQDMNQGEERWTLPRKPAASTDEHVRRQQQGERVRKKSRPTKKMGSATHASSSAAAVMFTIPEAIAALARPRPVKAVAYDLPTGAYLSYPVERSYHLGAMGRYGNTRFAMHTSLPYRPLGTGKGSSRSNNLKSDFTNAHTRFN
jgi:hypothetical protein